MNDGFNETMTAFPRLLFLLSRVCWLAGLIWAAAPLAHSQTVAHASADYLIQVWNSEDGLPQNSVNCLAQTPDGYLWIGTRSGGLARFDGTRFVIFNPQTTPELKDVELETLSVDSRGTLWITAGNESAASIANGKFNLVRERTTEPRWHPLQLVSEEADAVYLASFHYAIFRVPRNGAPNKAERIELEPHPPAPLPPPLVLGRDNTLWYITENHQVAQLPLSGPGAGHSKVFNLPSPARVLAKDSTGELWLATDQEFGTITDGGFTERTPTNGPAPHDVRQMLATPDGGLWLWDGSLLRKMSHGQWTLAAEQFQPGGNNQSLRFFSDSQGGL